MWLARLQFMDSPPKFIYRANRDKSSKIQFCCNFSQVDLKLYLAWTAHFLKNSGMSVELAITTLDFIRVEGGGGVAKCSEGCLVNETLKSKNTGTYNWSCCRFCWITREFKQPRFLTMHINRK